MASTKPDAPNPLWNKSQDNTLTHLLELGWNYSQIGGRLGKSPDAVRNRRTRLGVSKPLSRGHLWSNEEDETIKTLWAEGISGREIAGKMGETYGHTYTRNSIIGRAHRLRLTGRKPPPRKPRKERTTKVKLFVLKGFAAPRPAPPPPAEDHAFKSFGELTGAFCSFVQGEPKGLETLMCGLPREINSYCGYHHWITHEKRPRARAVTSEVAPPLSSPVGDGATSL